jgi:hypothetical protein
MAKPTAHAYQSFRAATELVCPSPDEEAVRFAFVVVED